MEKAAEGTLFLDEIGNLPPEVQQMLLRALESKMYRPTGGSKDKKSDVRIIAATMKTCRQPSLKSVSERICTNG